MLYTTLASLAFSAVAISSLGGSTLTASSSLQPEVIPLTFHNFDTQSSKASTTNNNNKAPDQSPSYPQPGDGRR